MRKTEIIDRRFKELLDLGEQVLATRTPPPPNSRRDSQVDSDKFQEWATSTLQFLGSNLGRDSEYYIRLQPILKYASYFGIMQHGLGVLKAAWNDYSKGYLIEAKLLITAEVFDDILEQAEQLLEQGYHQAAAVLAGCVLEDTLRKMCQRNGINLPAKPNLDRMNSELARKAVYNSLVQKRITTLADIRNKAAHGQCTEFSKKDVQNMLIEVRRFVTEHFES